MKFSLHPIMDHDEDIHSFLSCSAFASGTITKIPRMSFGLRRYC